MFTLLNYMYVIQVHSKESYAPLIIVYTNRYRWIDRNSMTENFISWSFDPSTLFTYLITEKKELRKKSPLNSIIAIINAEK